MTKYLVHSGTLSTHQYTKPGQNWALEITTWPYLALFGQVFTRIANNDC